MKGIGSAQIIGTSHDLTPNGGSARGIPLFQGNLGWRKIIIWPDWILRAAPQKIPNRPFCHYNPPQKRQCVPTKGTISKGNESSNPTIDFQGIYRDMFLFGAVLGGSSHLFAAGFSSEELVQIHGFDPLQLSC